MTFRGLFPVESPWGVWGKMQPLPWCLSYYSAEDWRLCHAELDQLWQLMMTIPLVERRRVPRTQRKDELALKTEIQTVCVHVLFSIDQYFGRRNRGLQAQEQLCNAYHEMLELCGIAAEFFAQRGKID